jgi:hypothetical protein
MSGLKSGLKWALIVSAGLAVAPVAAQAKDPSFSIVVNPAPMAAPRYAPPREDYRRDRDRRESAYRYREDRYRDDRRHDARRGPPPHAPAYGYRRQHDERQQLAPGIYIVPPHN